MGLLVVDIGGTNARFAIVHGGKDGSGLRSVRVIECAAFASLGDAIRAYLERRDVAITAIAIAVAGPVGDNRVDVTNNHWGFEKQTLQAEFGVERLVVVNDFTAQALAQEDPAANGNILIRAGRGDASAPLLVIGPGTGLGVAALIATPDGMLPLAGEGGHVSFAPRSKTERELLDFLGATCDHVSAERVVSGPGLENIHRFLAATVATEAITDADAGADENPMTAPEIGAAAVAADGLCREAAHIMLGCLGTVIANAVLTLGARRGVVIAGGIVPQLQSLLPGSPFAQRMAHKGRMAAYLAEAPIWLSVDPLAGLKGVRNAVTNPHIARQIIG